MGEKRLSLLAFFALWITLVNIGGSFATMPPGLNPGAPDATGWTIIQQRLDNTFNFDRLWADYKAGFGDSSGNYWMSLDLISKIMNGGGSYAARFDLYLTSLNAWYSAQYGNFSVDPESNKYTLHVTGYVPGNTGDVLNGEVSKWVINGMAFSTPDNDNSGNACASTYRGGWWFNNCYGIDLNSPFNFAQKGVGYSGFDSLINGTTYSIGQSRILIQQQSAGLNPGAPDATGWTIIQQRLDTTFNFDRLWADYKAGFGDPSGNYWMSLDQISSITNGGGSYSARFDLYLTSLNAWYSAQYGSFSVDPESKKYTMHVTAYVPGNTGDVLNGQGSKYVINGMPFSTPDNDNSPGISYYGRSCTSTYRGGWWFNSCYTIDLNSPFNFSKWGLGWSGFDCVINGTAYAIGQSRVLIQQQSG